MSLRTELQALHQQFGREAAWSAVAEVCHIAIGDKATPKNKVMPRPEELVQWAKKCLDTGMTAQNLMTYVVAHSIIEKKQDTLTVR